jgi:hypothetical protein
MFQSFYLKDILHWGGFSDGIGIALKAEKSKLLSAFFF